MRATKLNEYQISVTQEEKPVQAVTNTYDRTFIEKQIVDITAQKDEQIAQRDAELKVCKEILVEMDRLKIVAIPVEPQ